MTFATIFGEVGFVAKVDVHDVSLSTSWYETKLGLVPDPRFQTPTWEQMNIPGVRRTAIGLNQGDETGTQSAVATFVVDDIVAARDRLIENGVDVGPIEEIELAPGEILQLAFFVDLDANRLGLRQNPPTQPKALEIGDNG